MASTVDVSYRALEVFSIVARRGPIWRAALEHEAGGDCGYELDELVIEALVDASGGIVRLTPYGEARRDLVIGGRR